VSAEVVLKYRADMDVLRVELLRGQMMIPVLPGDPAAEPACRCYRCGALLTAGTVQVDTVREVPVCGECMIARDVRTS
jgi:hypothetical protein